VDVEIDPEPPESVRRAILAALAAIEPEPQKSRWWRAGLADAVAGEEE
jgi:hypothetical protein